MKISFDRLREGAALWAGILLFIFFLLANPFGVEPAAARVLAVAALMITWWIGEAIPMAAVALLPLVLFPLMNISPIKTVAAAYADSVIFLFMGGFMLGLAIEKWELHKRIALTIVKITGTSGNRIILGFILATGLLSMWLSNTATTMMMFPIAASVIQVVRENNNGQGRVDHFALSIMLSIAYASNFGGIATIIGTPPNVAFVGFMSDRYKMNIEFSHWMALCTPVALLLMIALYFLLTKVLYPNRLASDAGTHAHIRRELERLGPVSGTEKRVLWIFGLTALLWMSKDLLNPLLALPAVTSLMGKMKLDDTIIALLGALALFITPAKKGNPLGSRKLLEWSDTSRMAWGILLLFGGGIALASAMEKAGLIEKLGQWIAGFAGQGGFVLVFMVALVSLFISEVMSNIAQVIVFSPVIAGISDAMHINPLLLGIPMALGASCASMMPMGTPPNAIVFASGHIRLGQMAWTGFIMNLVAVVLITLFSWYFVPLLL